MDDGTALMVVLTAIGSALTGIGIWVGRLVLRITERLFGRDESPGKPAMKGVIPAVLEEHVAAVKLVAAEQKILNEQQKSMRGEFAAALEQLMGQHERHHKELAAVIERELRSGHTGAPANGQ